MAHVVHICRRARDSCMVYNEDSILCDEEQCKNMHGLQDQGVNLFDVWTCVRDRVRHSRGVPNLRTKIMDTPYVDSFTQLCGVLILDDSVPVITHPCREDIDSAHAL